MTGELMGREMDEQPEVLQRVADSAAEIRERVRAIVPDPLDGIAFVGRGSSDNAAMLGRYASELAAHRPAGLAAPSLHTRYDSPVNYSGYLVIGLSQSGATPEVVATCERLRASGAVVIAITNDDSSALAAVSDLALSTDAGVELAVPATKTVTAEMALVLVLAGALGDGLPGATDLTALPDAVATVLSDDGSPTALAEAWAGYERLLVTARGLAYAAALETALKVKETSRIFAEGMSIADLMHGPIATVGAGLPVLHIDGGYPIASEGHQLVERLETLHAPIATCTPHADSTLPMPSGLGEVLYTIVATVRGQQLARRLSLARGLDPDHPSGLTKVTPTS
ncbi:MAG: SIS domain-containing protein [Acidimicrobiales bacterium]